MSTYVIRPKADVDANLNNFTNAVYATGNDPVTKTGLMNGTAYYAQELSPLSDAFIPVAGQIPGERSLTLSVNRDTGIAPAGIFFEAKATGWGVENHDHDLRYKWTFGDPGNFTALTERSAAMGWDDSNIAYGPWAAHTYAPSREDFAAQPRQDGKPAESLTFTATCEVTDGAHTLSETITVTIRNPDWVFRGNGTVLISNDLDEDWSEAPEDPYGGSYLKTTDIANPWHIVPSGVTDRRYLWKRGQVVEKSWVWGPFSHAMHQGAWGNAPEKPRIFAHGDNNIFTFKEAISGGVAIHDLELSADYDPVTETGQELGGNITALRFWADARGDYTLHNLDISGVGMGIYPSVKKGTPWSYVLSNSTIKNWRNMGVFGSAYHLACVGCSIKQHIDANGGSAGSGGHFRGTYNDHGPMRLGQPSADGFTVLDAVEMFSANGWSVNSVKGPDHQPYLRWNSDGGSEGGEDGSRLHASRIIGEGGSTMFSATSGRVNRRTNAIFDKIVAVASAAFHRPFQLHQSGITLRNFLILHSNAPGHNGTPGAGLIEFGAREEPMPGNAEGFLHVYNGTIISWYDPVAHGSDRDIGISSRWGPEFADSRFENIIYHAPNMRTPLDLSAELNLSQRLFAPSYKGFKWVNHFPQWAQTNGVPWPDQPILDPSYATPDYFDPTGGDNPTQALVVLPVPSGSLAVADMGPGVKVAIDDIFGRLRGPVPAKGAVEPF